MLHAGNCQGIMMANDIVRAPLTVCRQVAVGEVVGGRMLVSADPGAFENRLRETWKLAHVDLVGSAGGGVGRIVVLQFVLKTLCILVTLAPIGDHSQHLIGP